MASPRPRTQSGSATCAETLRIVSAITQDTPARTLAAAATGAVWADPKSTRDAAVASVARRMTPSGEKRVRSRDRKAAPTSAPTPMEARRNPYRSGPPPIRRRATSGSNAQYALAEKRNATVRTRVARSGRLLVAYRRPARKARQNRSAGMRSGAAGVGRHQSKPPTVARLLIALIQKGSTTPPRTVRAPPKAGPIARLMLNPTPLAATAGIRSFRGTSSGTMACQPGVPSAVPAAITNMNSRSTAGVIKPSMTQTAKIADKIVVVLSATISKRRRSTMSVSAPAGIANRNIGRLFATCTSETSSGSVLSVVMNQPQAALYIHVPMLATTPAVHSTLNAGYLKGAHAPPSASRDRVVTGIRPTEIQGWGFGNCNKGARADRLAGDRPLTRSGAG